jgi:hypothetical protein
MQEAAAQVDAQSFFSYVLLVSLFLFLVPVVRLLRGRFASDDAKLCGCAEEKESGKELTASPATSLSESRRPQSF